MRIQEMRDRLAAETPEEREVILQRMSAYQQERLAAEISAETEARLHHLLYCNCFNFSAAPYHFPFYNLNTSNLLYTAVDDKPIYQKTTCLHHDTMISFQILNMCVPCR